MGNQSSSGTISSFSFDTLILESVLNEVPTDNVSLSVQKIKNIKFNDFGVLADKIFEKGINNHFCSDKYAELAKKLCDEVPPDGFVTSGGAAVDWNLQDYLNRKAHFYFEVLHSCIENGKPLTNDRLYGISVFIGNLYNVDLISSERIYLWILNDAYPLATEVRKHILFTIKEKVLRTTENPNEVCNDPFVWELVDWLGKEGIIRPKLVAKPKPKIQAKTPNEPSSSASSAAPNVKPSQVSIPVSFEQYLKSIKAPPVRAFDIQLFRSCSDHDRKESAKRMLTSVLLNSTLAPKYARLALSILQLNMKPTAPNKTFINHLSDLCEKQLESYKEINTINWIEMESYGTFLAELYNLEVLRIFIMNTWLDNTRKVAEENDLAIKMLFKIVKLVQQKMSAKDPRTLQRYLNHFETFRNTKRVPIAYMNWLQSAIAASKQRDRSSSAVSSASESSVQSSKTSTSTQSTGAVKKQQAIAQITQATSVCEDFTNYLIQLRTKNSSNYSIDLDTATDAAIRGCTLLLIEHSLLNDSQINMFVHVTKFIILKQIKKEDRLKVFTANFNLYIYAEMNKSLKTDDPVSSDWKKVEKLGKYICELYKQDVIAGSVVKAWLTKLEFTATIGSEEAAREFYATIQKVGDKLKNDFPQEYQQFRQFSNRERPKKQLKEEPVKTTIEKMQMLWSNEMRDFNYLINNLSTTPPEKLTSAIEKLKINDRQQMEMLVQVYFEAFKKHNGNPVYAYLARKLHEEIFKPSKISFKNLLIALAIKEFNTIFGDGRCSLRTSKERMAADCHAKCIGELYSIGWLDESILIACLDKFAGENFEHVYNLQVFRNFINNISLDIVENGHGECCQKFYKILQERSAKYPEAFNMFVCEDTIEILKNIWNMSKLRNAHNIDEVVFEEVLRRLTMENFALSTSRINLSTIGSQEDLKMIVKVLFQACLTHPDNVQMYVKFLDAIKDKKLQSVDGSVSSICDTFINHSKHEFENYAQNFELQLLPNIMTILSVNSELYNTCLSSFDDIKFCLDIFFVENSFNDDKIDCFYFFLNKIGSKADEERKEAMNDYFEKLNQAEMITEYVSQHVKALHALREKRWMSEDEFIEFSSVDDQKVEEFLKNIKDNEISSKCNILKQHVLASEKNIKDFLHVLFKCNLEDEKILIKSANFVKLLVSGESNEMKEKFIENLNQFMRCRSQTFSVVAKDIKDEKLRQKLVNIILLNANLYSQSIIDNGTIQQWLVPSFTSHLNLSEMSKLCLLVSPKIDESENVQLKARLMNLESAIQEKLMETCHSTKVDLNSMA